ncbi:MAG: hypothetical protein ABEJ58_00130 [Halodesulfurarchaeum sp.]
MGRVDEYDIVPDANLRSDQSAADPEEDIVIVESVGSAVMDAAAARDVLESADETGTGTRASL